MSKKSPQLRFEGFTDDWEERKLSDIADRFDNLRVPITASERKSGDTPYYGANGIQDYVEGFTHDGEFILVAEDGANDLKNYPVQYVNGKVWVNNHAHVLQGKNTITDNKFLMNSIKNFNIEPFLVGGGRAKLNADVMMKLNILLPTFDEQEKIGSFFKQLDDTIALHQRKLDLLKEQKKGFLQKMFPKNGKKVPELRFAGFADDWEQRKFGDVFETVTDYVAAGSFANIAKNVIYRDTPNYAQLIRTTDLKSGFNSGSNVYVDKKAFDFLYRVNLDKECIILPNIGNCGEVYYVTPEKLPYENNVLGPNAILVRSENSDNSFLNILLQGEDFQKRLALIINPNGQTKFNKTELKQIVLKLPQDFAEQQQIGTFFAHLDTLISLHQRKLDLLKEQKKGFLQKMFV